MPITNEQKAAASALQHLAAHDASPQARLVAGPGTGKSFVIEERVRWLLQQGISPRSLCVVSFTRASADDLRRRIRRYCGDHGLPQAEQVRVSTLHSLALRVLQQAGLLRAYPTKPIVLNDWEVENIFDAEFGTSQAVGKKRREEIRADHEAFWSTGQWNPVNYVLPDPPISQAERAAFIAFHPTRTQTYACVLPGEIVRQCVMAASAGLLNPAQLLKMSELVVDEYQDLNPIDIHMVDMLAASGVRIFVAGDDDQSIYAFRYASPAGLQSFTAKYPQAGGHTLRACFRCTTSVLHAGTTLIQASATPGRIQKQSVSLYDVAVPPNAGVVHRWRFANGNSEAGALADSCRRLIDAGVQAREILILLSNRRILGKTIRDALAQHEVEACYPESDGFVHSEPGKLALALARIVCNRDDYVAHRVVLAAPHGIGVQTCARICDTVVTNNLNFRDLFYQNVPAGVFTGRSATAVRLGREACAAIAAWLPENTLEERMDGMAVLLASAVGEDGAQAWRQYVNDLPLEMTLAELRDLMWADKEEQRAAVMHDVYNRLGQAIPADDLLPQKVRVMTMHGAKGLSGCVVFIPGLEQEILPGPWRQPYPGLVLEAARLLYVSVTRARVATIVSYAESRIVNGQFEHHHPSQFCPNLGGAFAARQAGLSVTESGFVRQRCLDL